MDTQKSTLTENNFDNGTIEPMVDSQTLGAADFRRRFSDTVDKRFLYILLGSLVFHLGLMTYFVLNPVSEDKAMRRIARIQEELARTIRERELELQAIQTKLALNEVKPDKPKPEAKKSKEDKPKAEKKSAKKSPKAQKGKDVAKRARRPRPNRGSRGKSRQQLANSVSSKGVLALLTSTSSVASGNEVADILTGRDHSQKDLDKAISGLSGIRTGGSGDANGVSHVKGGRSQSGGSIDDLVADLGETDGGSFERTGELVVVGESALVDGGNGNGIIGRNQDEVQGVILRHNSSIQYCYQRELKRNPNLKGKMVVRFSITPDGSVQDIEIVSSTLSNQKVECCVVNRIRR
ncbi:MAG: AgmX/PglI C-terminal domain-containing protein, partial [bacterium]